MKLIEYWEPLPLFVYGILKDQFAATSIIRAYDTTYENAKTDGQIYHLGGFPGAKFDFTEPGTIKGQIVTVPDNQFTTFIAKTDALEGFSPGREATFYDRKDIYVTVGERLLRAWAYEYVGDVNEERRIKTGEFIG